MHPFFGSILLKLIAAEILEVTINKALERTFKFQFKFVQFHPGLRFNSQVRLGRFANLVPPILKQYQGEAASSRLTFQPSIIEKLIAFVTQGYKFQS